MGENQTVSGKVGEHANTLYTKTKEVDTNRGISSKFHEYYQKSAGTPLGQRFVKFYTDTQKQVLDVHEEAKRIAVSRAFCGG